MASSVTFTGKIGPGNSVTSLVFNNVTSVVFNPNGQTVEIVMGSTRDYVDLSGVTTITCTVSGTNLTFTIS